MANTLFRIKYKGNLFWLIFWGICCPIISVILLFMNGIEFDGFEEKTAKFCLVIIVATLMASSFISSIMQYKYINVIVNNERFSK